MRVNRRANIVERNPRFRALVWTSIVTAAIGIGVLFVARARHEAISSNPSQPAAYEILSDEMGTLICIGVPVDTNEEQLRATLVKVADEHQDDAARDYMTSMYLWVEAYLVKDGQRSRVPAGSLRRFVPPGNAEERRRMKIDRGAWDSFAITLDEAKRTLQ